MKLICLVFGLYCSAFFSDSGIYDLKVQTLEGKTISFSALHGKKIVIAEFSAGVPDNNFLQTLESLKQGTKNLYLIAVPALDFSDATSIESLLKLKTTLKLSFDITEPAMIKKNGSGKQSVLFKWLTHASDNKHFDVDIDSDQQLYVINEKGTLYSMIGKGTEKKMIKEVIVQKMDE